MRRRGLPLVPHYTFFQCLMTPFCCCVTTPDASEEGFDSISPPANGAPSQATPTPWRSAADFETGRGRGTGHFTQVVWKDSTRVGCGVKLRCGGGMMAMTSVVCRQCSEFTGQ